MKKSNISVINFNKYERIDYTSLLYQGTKFITLGTDNEFFYRLDNKYYGSPTNQAIINSYVNYILGEGLVAESGIRQDILDKIIDFSDLKTLALELKKTGNVPLQVTYSKIPNQKKVAKIHAHPSKNVAIQNQPDLSDNIQGYWYCYDWFNKTKFKPYKVPAFKYGMGKESEIYYIKNNSTEPLFSMPDWVSGVQFAEMEEEISNYMLNHIKRNFSAGKIVNIYQGEAESEEAEDEVERLIKAKLSGSQNAGEIIVAFNKNTEEKITVENIEITDAYQQFEFLSEYCKKQLFTSHSVTSPSLFGADKSTGFSSDSDEMKTALRMLYRSQINPIRNKITSALEEILDESYPGIELSFKDFEELNVTKENDEKVKDIEIKNNNE